MKTTMANLKSKLYHDPSLAWVWQCNLAMAIYDEGVSHIAANKAAARIMKNFFDIDITVLPEYKEIVEG